ncbi:unnamed protein product [Parnassius apollo]|uniref:(apollo) hypothetical protein n=1 Tax=Parnassius apollo TaxID=110799 RepID=A0A8S3XB44_PARAO|nr:unnamed protein product [Parnassius apollo]
MSEKGEPPPTRRKPPDRQPGVLDRPLMERDLLAPEKSRVLPAYSQIPRRKGSPPATGVALGASRTEPLPIAEPAPLSRRNIASRRRTPRIGRGRSAGGEKAEGRFGLGIRVGISLNFCLRLERHTYTTAETCATVVTISHYLPNLHAI